MRNFSKKQKLWLIVLLFLALAIPLSIFQLNNYQIIRSRADTSDFYGRNINVLNIFGQDRISETTRSKTAANSVYHASGVTVDKTSNPNKLYVIDTGNSRILGFNGLDANPGRSADVVIGQPNFEDGACNGDNNLGIFNQASRETLCLIGYPVLTNTSEYWLRNNLDIDSHGNLYVVDVWNNRILKYNQPMSEDRNDGKGDSSADFVWGQDDFTSHEPNQNSYANPGSPTNKSLWLHSGPPDWVSSRGASVDSDGNVWVADTFNNRVLRFSGNSNEANLVLGQDGFNSNGCSRSGDLNRFCTPTLAKVDPETGDLFVIDEFPAPFKARILVFRPPFTNGMAAYKSIVVNQGPPLWPEGYIFQATGLVFNTFFREGSYASGKIWVNEHSSNRTLLLDTDGRIIKAINVKDNVTRGGDEQYAGSCGSIYSPERLWWPGGSIGFDAENNIYLADERFGKVFKYTLPYNLTQTNCLPEPSGSFLMRNQDSPDRLGEAMGLTVFGNQLIVKDEGGKLKIWNDYLNKPLGSSADIVLNADIPGRGFMSQAIDDKDRLWSFNPHTKLKVFQLPFRGNDLPLADFIKLYWADTNEEVDYGSIEGGIAFDNVHKYLYIVDGARILRVRNYDDLSGRILVDMVIGQTDRSNKNCNQGLSSPNAGTFCDPRQLAFDKNGNLFVVDNSHECRGNNRVTVFMSEDLVSATSLFPNLQAQKAFVAPDLNSSGGCAPSRNTLSPHSPISLSFNTDNKMVLTNDGYYTDNIKRYLKQIWFYNDPLNNQLPTGSVALPMGAPGEIVFDASNNLLIQDHTWNRVWMINLATDPSWIVAPDFFAHLDSPLLRSGMPLITQPPLSTPTPIGTAPPGASPTNPPVPTNGMPSPTRVLSVSPSLSPQVSPTPSFSLLPTLPPLPTQPKSQAPTPSPRISRFDLNSDGAINSVDIFILIRELRKGTSGSRIADLNDDKVLNSFDFAILRKNLGS